MSKTRTAVIGFIRDFRGETPSLSDDTDLFDTLGLEGDDAGDFMEAFTERFGVNGAAYRWYFHHGEEGLNFGGWLFKPPYRRVPRIAITPSILGEAARTGRWPLIYPDHTMPKVRWDIRINQALAIVCLALLVTVGLWKWSGWWVA